ncbi:hypothetical protein AB5I41_04600 [Sphingomonas sp. MMS24-JH45]
MTDQIDALTAAQERELAELIEAAVAYAIDTIPLSMLAPMLANADDEGPKSAEHYQEQLASFLGTDTTDDTDLAAALDTAGDDDRRGLQFFAAVLALAARPGGPRRQYERHRRRPGPRQRDPGASGLLPPRKPPGAS